MISPVKERETVPFLFYRRQADFSTWKSENKFEVQLLHKNRILESEDQKQKRAEAEVFVMACKSLFLLCKKPFLSHYNK